jgi:hypothetical protein
MKAAPGTLVLQMTYDSDGDPRFTVWDENGSRIASEFKNKGVLADWLCRRAGRRALKRHAKAATRGKILDQVVIDPARYIAHAETETGV